MYIKKLSILFIIALFLCGSAFAADVTLKPSTVPIGAYLNGSDGDQYFVQSLKIDLEADGSGASGWEDGDAITINLPSSMTIADVDDGTISDYDDEVSVSASFGAAITVAVTTPNSQTITLTLNGAAPANNDEITVFFPALVPSTLSDSTQEDYTFSTSDDEEDWEDANATVTYTDDVLNVVGDFAGDYKDGDESSLRGKYYPSSGDKTNAAADIHSGLADIIEEVTGNGNDDFVNGGSDWDGFDLDNDNADDDEVLYYLWACKDSSLRKIREGAGENSSAHIPIASTQPTDAINGNANNGDPISWVAESDLFDDALLNGTLLDEGTWYFYITSNVTSDWVIGRSDSVAIHHQPVFNAYDDGTMAGGVLDYDGDVLFESGAATDDDVAEMYLESGGGVARNGEWADDPAAAAGAAGDNTDEVKIHWEVEDVDDNANVKVYLCENADIDTVQNLIADPTTFQISPDTLYEEGPTSQYWTYDIYTDEDTYEPAGTYYVYMVADDGNNANLYQVKTNAGTNLDLIVKHFPYLSFQDLDDVGTKYETLTEEAADADSRVDINTAEDEYFLINWGTTVDGDLDADGDMRIKLYAADIALDNASTGYNIDVSAVDTTALATYAENNPTAATHIATIVDDSDTREANRYMWNVKNSGLAAGSYNIFAVITEKGDGQVVTTYGSATFEDADGEGTGDYTNDTHLDISHGQYFIPENPPEGQVVNLDGQDRFTLKWNGFDKDATSSNLLVTAFIVPEGTADQSSATFDGDGVGIDDGYYLPRVGAGGTVGQNYNTADDIQMNQAEMTVDLGVLTTDMNGDADVPATGDYDLYYVYTDDGDFTDDADDYCVKADGQIHIDQFDAPATSFEVSPSKITAEKGDTVSIDVYADDGGGEAAQIVSVHLNIPTANFSVIDQDNSTSGIQPWDDESTNFDGDEMLNEVSVEGDYHYIDYIEMATGGDAIASLLKIGTIQLEVTGNNTNNDLDSNYVVFNKSGNRETGIVGINGNELVTSVPDIAANVLLTTPGTISGNIDVQARPDVGEEVSLFVCPEGSFDMITDSDFLAANGDEDASDGLQITLGEGGAYTIEQIPTGTYDIICKKDGWLDQRIKSQTIQPLSNTNVDFEGANKLMAGDPAGYTNADGDNVPDNQIDSDDDNAMSEAFNATSEDENWNAYCDFNGDGLVYIEDLNYKELNTGNGEGILYKKSLGSNANAIVGMRDISKEGSRVVYEVFAEKVADIRAYGLEMDIDPAQWKIVDYKDGLSEQHRSFSLQKAINGNMHFASAIVGPKTVANSEIKLFTLTLESKVANPEEPELYNARLINIMNKATDAQLMQTALPEKFSLENNYPNPFNPTTNIKFALPKAGNVKLTIYNMLGQKVRTLVSKEMKAGHYNVQWNATNEYGAKVSSGLYFYRMQVGGKHIGSRKMILMK